MFQRNLDYFMSFYNNIKENNKSYDLICWDKIYSFIFDWHYFGSNDIGELEWDSSYITRDYNSYYWIYWTTDFVTILQNIDNIHSYEIEIKDWNNPVTILNEDDRIADYYYLDDYHENESEDLSNWAQIKVWLEIERKNYLTRWQVKQLINNKWRCEKDWSVDWWEYITPILDINKAYNFIEETKFVLNWRDSSSKCGWHIHISHSNYNSHSLYAWVRYYRPILWALYPSRSLNNYSSKEWDPEEHSVDVWIRYCTVEFRIFPILRSLKQVKFRLALLNFFVNNLATSKNRALEVLNEKSLEFISILDIAYKSLERKQEVLERIINAFEINSEKDEEIKTFLKKQCNLLNK